MVLSENIRFLFSFLLSKMSSFPGVKWIYSQNVKVGEGSSPERKNVSKKLLFDRQVIKTSAFSSFKAHIMFPDTFSGSS
jgi:hypothetical protein